MADISEFLAALAERTAWVDEFLAQSQVFARVRPEHLRRLVAAYLERGGKRLRPSVLLLACGAVGGRERDVLPAAAALELFHTWTLMHDDIIDHDALRRGGPTGHVLGAELGATDWQLDVPQADDYGISLSMLAGDVQHGLCVWTFLQGQHTPAPLLLHLVGDLELNVVADLVEGETLDVQFERRPAADVTMDEALRMMYLKTGALYEFAGKAGAMLGLETADPDHPLVAALRAFCAHCGTAFQLQDDVLGVVGEQGKLGKPVGSDILEGKRTPILLKTYELADDAQSALLDRVVGNPQAAPGEVAEVTSLMVRLGAVAAVSAMARQHVAQASAHLARVPASQYTRWLAGWANFMIEREL